MAKTATRSRNALDTSLQSAEENARQLGTVLAHQQQSQTSASTQSEKKSAKYGISDEEEEQIYFAYHLANLLSDVSCASSDRRADINIESFSVVMMMLKNKLKLDLLHLGR